MNVEIKIVRTFECKYCLRFDSIMMDLESFQDAIENGNGVGEHLIKHGDHNRTIYYNKDEEYLGDSFKFTKWSSWENIWMQRAIICLC